MREKMKMRRPILNLAIFVIILTLSFSFIAVLPVTSQNEDEEEIESLLRDLHSKVEEEHPCLANKVNAVIHQIEAGAFHGALNKMVNDVNKTITAWVENPAELYPLVNKIVDLIKGITPPTPYFEISAYPKELEIEQGKSDTSTIKVKSFHGFSQRIDLSAELTPTTDKVTLALDPTWVIPTPSGNTSTLTVAVAADADPGEYVITVTGTNGTLPRSEKITLTVTPLKDFSIEASPASLIIQQGGSAISVITVTSLEGFSRLVDLAITSQQIPNVDATLNPLQVIPLPNKSAVSILTINVDSAATPSSYSITVNGTSGSLRHSVKIVLEVTAPPVVPTLDLTPPVIVSVLRQPETPSYNETVTVLASVTDIVSGVKEVILSYSGGTTWKNETMTLKDELYRATVPAFPYNTKINYRVYASDNIGNWAAPSSVYSYVVADPYPPVIGYPSWSPEQPAANEEINITVTVTEPRYSSGVEDVILWYTNTTMDLWASVPMTFKGDENWMATVTNQSDTVVTFFIEAFDNAGNMAESEEEYEITVAAPPGVPLAWILLAIAAIGAGTGGGVYYWRRRRKKSRGIIA